MLVFLCGNFVGVEQPTCTLIFTPTLCFLVKEMKKSSTQHPCLHDSFGNWKILHPPRKSSFIPLSWCDTFGPCTTYEHIIDIVHTYTPLHWNAETWHPLFWLDMLTVKRKFLKKKAVYSTAVWQSAVPFFCNSSSLFLSCPTVLWKSACGGKRRRKIYSMKNSDGFTVSRTHMFVLSWWLYNSSMIAHIWCNQWQCKE